MGEKTAFHCLFLSMYTINKQQQSVALLGASSDMNESLKSRFGKKKKKERKVYLPIQIVQQDGAAVEARE